MNGKKLDLYNWCRAKGIFSSVDVHKWGLDNYYICAKRRVLEMVEEGKRIRKLKDGEVKARGLHREGRQRTAWYVFDENAPQFELELKKDHRMANAYGSKRRLGRTNFLKVRKNSS